MRDQTRLMSGEIWLNVLPNVQNIARLLFLTKAAILPICHLVLECFNCFLETRILCLILYISRSFSSGMFLYAMQAMDD